MKKFKKTGQRGQMKHLKKKIVDAFMESDKPQNYKQIAKKLGKKDSATIQSILVIIGNLRAENTIIEAGHGKFEMAPRGELFQGTVDMTASGAAFVIVEGMDTDVYVHQKFTGNALQGDTVELCLIPIRKRGGRPEGEIVNVVKRAREFFVGILEMHENHAFLVTERAGTDIFIPKEKYNGAKNGQKVIARMTDWPKRARSPFGEITEILGNPGEHNTEIHAILAEYGLPYRFPDEVEAAAQDINTEITEEEVSRRRDMRDITTFTIDPVDAKDFDDALSIQKLDNGNWEIGIHIADVSHYVEAGSVLDQEAYLRATSVYLVDRVVPMLPEVLSNQVCSLRPHEEKLCFSAIFEIDDKAKMHKQWFGRTVICSDHRFTYEEAQEIIEQKDGIYKDEVLKLDELAKIMRQQRMDAGAISFDRIEVKFRIDPEGNPEGIFFKQAKDSNQLIEEFMLLANKKVAEFIGLNAEGKDSGKTFVYRVHDVPDPDKIQALSNFVRQFGHTIRTNNADVLAKSLSQLMKDISGNSEENIVEQLAVRTMSKAKYTTDNIGHYGLGFSYYSHFTSPIRRYPDVILHRLLQAYLTSSSVDPKAVVEEQCKHASQMEKLSSEAERSSIKFMQVKYMQDKVGQTFEGVVSGVTEWGMYVELLESKCEGMIALQDIESDYFIADKENYCVVGQATKETYRLGDLIKISVKNADLVKKQLDFRLVQE